MMEPSEYLDSETAKTEFGRILGGKKKKRSKKSAIMCVKQTVWYAYRL